MEHQEPFSVRFGIAWERWKAKTGKELQEDFARAIDTSESGVTPLKNALKPPTHERILKIAMACDVDPGWLAYGADSQAPMEREWPELKRPGKGRLMDEVLKGNARGKGAKRA